MFNLIFGILFLVLGLITLFLRLFKSSKGMKKLDKFKEFYGEKAGTIIHIISYTVVPIVIGIILIVASCMGIASFE